MAKKMFVYLLFLSMIITIVSFPVNAEETDMPSLSTEKLTEDTTSVSYTHLFMQLELSLVADSP